MRELENVANGFPGIEKILRHWRRPRSPRLCCLRRLNDLSALRQPTRHRQQRLRPACTVSGRRYSVNVIRETRAIEFAK